MPIERYFVENVFCVHDCQEIEGAEFHHLAHVMRTRKNDVIELVNGRGALAKASVLEITKQKAMVKIEEVAQEPLHPCRLILAQAFPKPNRLDFILEKGTELGVDSFWLFPGMLSPKKEFFPQQLERARQVTIAAMKQCGRLTLPNIVMQPSLEKLFSTESSHCAFFGDLSPDALPFENVWKNLHTFSYPVVFVTGPESGFHQKEVDFLKNQGVLGVKLHPYILRTETASLMALSLLSHWLYNHFR